MNHWLRSERFSFSCSDVSQESCRFPGSQFTLQTCISRRACYSLQPRVSGQKTSPCIRTRWPCILQKKKKKKSLSLCNLTFSMLACLGPLVEVLRIAKSDVGCSPACIAPTHGYSGSCRSLGITNMIMNGWLVKCYCLILFCTVKCTLDDRVVIAL